MGFNQQMFNDRPFSSGRILVGLPPTMARYRDRDLLKLVASLLKATGSFDAVLTTPLPETLHAGSDRLKVASLDLAGWSETAEFDGNPSPTDRTVQFFLTLAVRNQDPQLRDDELDRLAQLASNTINHQPLGGETYYQMTRLKKGVWAEPEGPERRMKILGEWVQSLSNVTDHNDTRT